MSVAMEAGNSDVGVLLYAHEERLKSSSVLVPYCHRILPVTMLSTCTEGFLRDMTLHKCVLTSV